ncbi:MAG: CNNM domain-containing protein [Planctomycetota bacterium]
MTILWPLVVLSVGLALSAFFSGSETGYYRVPRVRLVIDSVAGSRAARGLLWASNHPEAFVATALVGNNLANYLVSAAIVTLGTAIAPGAGLPGEIALTLAFAPLVFLLGELLPKQAFLLAPYRLLRRASPLMLAAGVLLAVPSSLLWLASRALTLVTGNHVEPLRVSLRRREVRGVFDEGQAAGLLNATQRDLAAATFSVGGRPVRDFMVPIARFPRLPRDPRADDVLRIARRHQADAWPVEEAGDPDRRTRFARASRAVTATDPNAPVETMAVFRDTTPFLEAITHLESHAQPIAAVRDATGRTIGYVRIERLQDALWEAA